MNSRIIYSIMFLQYYQCSSCFYNIPIMLMNYPKIVFYVPTIFLHVHIAPARSKNQICIFPLFLHDSTIFMYVLTIFLHVPTTFLHVITIFLHVTTISLHILSVHVCFSNIPLCFHCSCMLQQYSCKF